MFQTFDHAKLKMPVVNLDEHVWAYTELMLNLPWFFADCQITENNLSVTTSYLFSNLAQLKDLESNSNVQINGVYVISPPNVNCTKSWKMDALAKASSGIAKDSEYQQHIEIYELKSGAKYYSCSSINDETEIECIQIIYKI